MRVPNVHCANSEGAHKKTMIVATRRIPHLSTLLGSRWIVAGGRAQGAGRRWFSRHRTSSCRWPICALPPAPRALRSHRANPARRVAGARGVVDAREHDPRLLVEAARRAAAEAVE